MELIGPRPAAAASSWFPVFCLSPGKSLLSPSPCKKGPKINTGSGCCRPNRHR